MIITAYSILSKEWISDVMNLGEILKDLISDPLWGYEGNVVSSSITPLSLGRSAEQGPRSSLIKCILEEVLPSLEATSSCPEFTSPVMEAIADSTRFREEGKCQLEFSMFARRWEVGKQLFSQHWLEWMGKGKETQTTILKSFHSHFAD